MLCADTMHDAAEKRTEGATRVGTGTYIQGTCGHRSVYIRPHART